MKNKIFYLPKFQDSGTLPESTEYYGGNLNSSKVSETLSRDQWNNLYKQGKVSLSQIPRKYQSWIEGENSDFKQSITNAIDNFGTNYVAPTLATALSFSPVIGGAIDIAQTGFDLATGNLLGAGLSILPGNINKIKNRLNTTKLSLLLNNNIKKYNISPSRLRGYKNLIDEPLGSMWNKDTHLYDLLTGKDIGNLSTTTANYRKGTIPSINQVIGSSKANHVSQDLYNTRLLQSSNGLISGESLVHPEITERVWKHFPFAVIGNYGLRNGNKTGKVVNLNRATEYLPEINLEHFKVIE